MKHHSSNDKHSRKITNDIQWYIQYRTVQYANIWVRRLQSYSMVRKHLSSQPRLSTYDINGSISDERPQYVQSVAASTRTMRTVHRYSTVDVRSISTVRIVRKHDASHLTCSRTGFVMAQLLFVFPLAQLCYGSQPRQNRGCSGGSC